MTTPRIPSATRWALPLLALGLLAAPTPGNAQAANPSSWRSAINGDGLWLMEPYVSEFVQRGTWVRFNNIDALGYASVGDVVPFPVEFEAAFDPAWGGGEHRVYAEIIVKVDGQVTFTERIPEAGYWPSDSLQVTAHRTAMIGIGQAPADGELTVEVLGILYNDGNQSLVDSNGLPIYDGSIYQGHPYYGGSRFNTVSVLKETRRVQHLRVDNPFVVDNLAMKTTGTCPGPAEVSFVARTAFGGLNALHPKAIEVRVTGLEDKDGWDWSPEMGSLTMGPNDHRQMQYTGVYRGADPCEVYRYAGDIVVTASGKFGAVPSSNWNPDIQQRIRQYWDERTWRSRFTLGSGAQAKPMPIAVTASCQGEGENCDQVLEPAAIEMQTEARFRSTERAPRRDDGPLQNPDELSIFIPAGALEGETIRGTVVARGGSREALSPESLRQITLNNDQVKPFEKTVTNDDKSASAQQFTYTVTNGGGLIQAALSTSKGPVQLTTMTIMAEESFDSVNTTVLTANVPDVWCANPSGTPLWAPGAGAGTSPLASLPSEAYVPKISWTDPAAPLVTGLAGSGPRQLVTLTDAEVGQAAAANPYMALGLVDALSERYRQWAADPYKSAADIVQGTAPAYISPGSYFTYVGPTPSAGGRYTASNGRMEQNQAGYASGWDPNKSTLQNIALLDPQTGAVVERIPVISQSSIMATGYVPEGITPGAYDIGLETNDGQMVKTARKTIAVQMVTDNDKVVQRGTQGQIRFEVKGHDKGKEKEQDEKKDGKELRPELRFFWNTISMLPGDWSQLGYAPRRGSFLNEFAGAQRPDAGQQQGQGKGTQQKTSDTDRLWKKEKKQPEMFVTIFNLTPNIIRFADGREVVTMPVYSDTTEFQLAFTGLSTGPYAVRIQVEEPKFSALEPDRLRNLNPEENPLLKLATNGWDESVLEGYDLPLGQ